MFHDPQMTDILIMSEHSVLDALNKFYETLRAFFQKIHSTSSNIFRKEQTNC